MISIIFNEIFDLVNKNNVNNSNNAKTINEFCSTYNYVFPKNNKIEKYLLPYETVINIKGVSNNNKKLNKNNLIDLIITPVFWLRTFSFVNIKDDEGDITNTNNSSSVTSFKKWYKV